MELMDKSAKKFVNDDLDKFDYRRIKESITKKCSELRNKMLNLNQRKRASMSIAVMDFHYLVISSSITEMLT